jgi:hypothetical protein
MNCKLITTTSDISKCAQLERSLKHFGWPYHIIQHDWRGFGSKIIETYRYLKANSEITHFFYSDAWDTFAVNTMGYALSQIPDKDVILFSAEKACYPHPEKASRYPEHKSPWHFLNGGGWFASSKLFCEMIDRVGMPANDINDQEWFTDRFLDGHHGIVLDYNCSVFQTIGFCSDDEFSFDLAEMTNKYTGSMPVFVHGNGHTPMNRVYSLPLGGFLLDSSGSRELALAKAKSCRTIDIGGSTSFADGHLEAIADFNQPRAKAQHYFEGNINNPYVWDEIKAYVKRHGKFDFAICTHTLEDISNPAYVCSQIEQIADSGYIVVPSKYKEMGRFSGPYRGFIHHRWIFDVVEQKLTAYPKINYIEHPKFDVLNGVTDKDELTFWWKDKIDLRVINNDWLGPTVEAVEGYYDELLKRDR